MNRFGSETDTRIYESKSLVSVPLMDSTQRMASMKRALCQNGQVWRCWKTAYEEDAHVTTI